MGEDAVFFQVGSGRGSQKHKTHCTEGNAVAAAALGGDAAGVPWPGVPWPEVPWPGVPRPEPLILLLLVRPFGSPSHLGHTEDFEGQSSLCLTSSARMNSQPLRAVEEPPPNSPRPQVLTKDELSRVRVCAWERGWSEFWRSKCLCHTLFCFFLRGSIFKAYSYLRNFMTLS